MTTERCHSRTVILIIWFLAICQVSDRLEGDGREQSGANRELLGMHSWTDRPRACAIPIYF